MANTKKAVLSKRSRLIELIKAKPGITSRELAEQVGFDSSSKVTTALWHRVRSGHIITERVPHNGFNVNAHYMADQIPPDAVERINQRLVDAADVIPAAKSPEARNSVFDVPSIKRSAKRPNKQPSPSRLHPPMTPTSVSSRATSREFACAITNDGSLVLMRAGEIQFSLTDVEAATLQSYLVKRAAASLFANMA
ncbi:winged helix-turn-helix domain-containing protein [Paraburkholderia sp. BL18I3N2]|uniref:winged helix-turn-helix domain-containing protein n=1 Tax=Paraburkholderia sp. BL18I3N2 TaxID=1938799 RepID=UPI000D05FE40|nr:winged helix-turn-helix domain-containing protein [Paraburkholderia sp. BL18I3N2]